MPNREPQVGPKRVDHVEAMRHLDPAGALVGLEMDDPEGMALRAAVDVWGAAQTEPVSGNAALRSLLKAVLAHVGLWSHAVANDHARAVDGQQ